MSVKGITGDGKVGRRGISWTEEGMRVSHLLGFTWGPVENRCLLLSDWTFSGEE